MDIFACFLYEEAKMTETLQPVSIVHIQEKDNDISFSCYHAVKEAKVNARDNLQILVSLYDSTNDLCKSLDRLNNLVESLIFDKKKEKGKGV